MEIGLNYSDYSREQLIEEIVIFEMRIAELETIQFHHEGSEQALLEAEIKLNKLNEELEEEVAERIAKENDLREYSVKLARTVVELGKALKQVQTLQTLIPMCSSCKSIRDDKGYWLDVERYLQSTPGAEVTHTLCMSCVKELYPEQYSRIVADM